METYEAPEVVTFGELEFEPATIPNGNGTIIVCRSEIGYCSTQVVLR
jgi:hypothetical protein